MNYDVTLVIVPSSDNQIRMIRGVMEYAQSVDGFRIAKNAAIPYVPWSMLERTKSDGVVAYAETKQQAALLARLNVPTVNLTLHQKPSRQVPAVHSDNGLIGSWSAEHLLSLGLRHFAFVGHLKWYHNELRCNGFEERLRKAGFGLQKSIFDSNQKRRGMSVFG